MVRVTVEENQYIVEQLNGSYLDITGFINSSVLQKSALYLPGSTQELTEDEITTNQENEKAALPVYNDVLQNMSTIQIYTHYLG